MFVHHFISTLLPNIFIIILSYYSLSFLKLLFRNLVSPLIFSKYKQIRKFGNWIVITGATDGIGKGFAEVLAKEKYNLVLISRSIDKLEKVKSEILSKNKIEIKLIDVDFTKVDIYEKIEKELKNLDVGLLINNVGMSAEFPDYLTSETNSDQGIVNTINCNCLSTVRMTKLLLKLGMASKGGFILNISSAAGVLPIGLFSVYGSTKSFINSFTVNMSSELKHSKVTFQAVAPFLVSTNMSKVRPSLFIPTPRSYAESVIKRLGTCSFTHGCFTHEFQGWILGLLPKVLLEKLIYSANLNIRKRALRKAGKCE